MSENHEKLVEKLDFIPQFYCQEPDPFWQFESGSETLISDTTDRHIVGWNLHCPYFLADFPRRYGTK
jgi:hypothetical protein